jgi:putative membrane protein
MKAVVLAGLIGGLVLGTAIIGYFGFAPVAHVLFAVGWAGFAALVACHLAIIACLGFCWYLLAPRAAPLGAFVWGRLIRDSSAELLPLSALGGFVLGARATMLLGLSGASAFATTIVDVTQELIGQLAYTALGLAILHWRDPDQELLGWAAAGLAVGCLATLGFMVTQRHGFGIAERAARRLARRWAKDRVIEEATVHREILALHRRPGVLACTALLHFAVWLASGVEAWLALRFMGAPLPLAAVFAIESLLYAIRSVAFAVPNGFGVQEGALVLLGAAFGLPPEAALALSVLKRARDLVIGVPALLAWQTLESRRAMRHPPGGENCGQVRSERMLRGTVGQHRDV